MIKRITSLITLLALIIAQSAGQVLTGTAASARVPGADLVRITEWSDVPGYVHLKPASRVPQQDLETWLIQAFNLSATYHFHLIKQETDKLGWSHFRYEVAVRDGNSHLPVEGASLVAHCRHGFMESVSGFVPGGTLSVNPTVAVDQARQAAIASVGAQVYKWQIGEEEQRLRYELGPQATYYPEGELVLTPAELSVPKAPYVPAWKFNIYAHQPMSRQMVYVDANSGEVLYSIALIHTSDTTGTAVTRYSGTRTIITDYTGTTFRLREAGRGDGIETYDLNQGTNYGAAVDFTDADNYWNNINAQQDEVATDAHWGAEVTYDYFWLEQGRNSIDDNGFLLRSYVHYSTGYNNAFWDGSRMTYGDGNGSVFTPLTAIDVCGHEITHGLTEFTASLVYSYESGALNESFSDIFGTVIEWYGRPTDWNYLIGEDMTPSGGGIRNMQNPNQFTDPDTYLGTYWYTGAGDNGGVHTNSGVQNKWFYILAEGETGTNDNGDSYNVSGIGIDAAADIAFRSLTIYLSSNSQYDDARFYAIQAAVDLFGACSPEVIATTNAWYAVGVGGPWVDVAADFSAAPTTTCTGDIAFTDLSNGAAAGWFWDFGDGNTDTVQNPLHTYAQNGTYDVMMVAVGCLANDTLTKTNYITVNRPDAPTTTSAAVCDSGSVTLIATGSGGTLTWYDAPVGGNVVGTGNTFTTPVLTTTTTYYVEETVASSPVSVGPPNNSFGTGGYFGLDTRWNYFDCYSPVILNSVKVYAGSAGNRTIQLRDGSGNILQQTTVNLPSGQSVVTLNFNVPAGTDLRLTVSGTADLYRNNSGPSYPYTYPGLMSITRSNATAPYDYYYFFYDLQIQPAPCRSIRGEATVTVNATNPASITPSGPTTFCSGGSVTLTANNLTYSWSTGASTQSITATSTGLYAVTTTDVNGCVSSASQQVTVHSNPVVTTSSDAAICSGSSTPLSANGALNYSWLPLTSLSCGNCSNPTANPTQTTTYVVTGTDANGCTDSEDVTVTVNQLPNVVATVQDPDICSGTCTQLGAIGAVTYSWSPPSGLNNPAISNPNACPAGSTTYTVIGTDANGCSNTASVTITVNDLPTVTASSIAVCPGLSGTLMAGGASTYQWSPGTGLSCTNCSSPTASPNVTTTYTVIGTDANGCQDQATATVTVYQQPILTCPFSNVSICLGQSAQLSSAGAVSYVWQPGNLTGQTITVSPTVTTIYTVTGTDGNGCQASLSAVVVVQTLPPVSAGPDQAICEGQSVLLVGTGGPGIQSYLWSCPVSCPTCQSTIASPDTTTVCTLTVTDNNGCTNSDDVTITVNELPTLTVSDDTAVCAGQSAQLNASGAATYQWSNSSTLSCATCPNPLASPDQTTAYIVTGTSAEGCSSSESVLVTVAPLPDAQVTSTAELCEGQSVQLQASGGTTYSWSPSTGLSCTNCDNPVASPGTPITYTVTVTDSNGCSESVTSNVNVHPLPSADFSHTSSDPSFSFSDQSTDAQTWHWDFGDGDTSTLQDPQHTYTANGNYTVTLIVWNGPCSDTITKEIAVTGVGIYEPAGVIIGAYPNPTSGRVWVVSDTPANGKLFVTNDLGQAVIDPVLFEQSTELDLSGLAPGVYFVELRGGQGNWRTAVVKE